MDKMNSKLRNNILLLVALFVFIAIASLLRTRADYSLSQYANDNPEIAHAVVEKVVPESSAPAKPNQAASISSNDISANDISSGDIINKN